MLRKLRRVLATLSIVGITLLFLDFTGTLHHYLGWLAKIQLLPAVLAGNFVIVTAIVLLTLVFGRFYCSVICPLGITQDIFTAWGMKRKKNRHHWRKNRIWLRVGALAVFVVLMIIGLNSIALLVAPYSAFGRIATTLLGPIYRLGNNALATICEHFNGYLFYSVEVWTKCGITLAVATVTLALISVLSFRYGRLWCNTICPVGTVLGLISRFSLIRPEIDESKCINCGRCAKNCKGSCIDPEDKKIDYSRCVGCMDCLENCSANAIHYRLRMKGKDDKHVDESRRKFLFTTASVGTAIALQAQEKKVDGGLAVIEDKILPKRSHPLLPPGSKGEKHFAKHCTACQLCVSECPSHILAPSKSLERLMQPEIQYSQGYCKPDCTRCSSVCPTGAISKITPAEKTEIKIGHAVVVLQNCISARGEICGQCARRCTAAAISMVKDPATGHLVPAVNESRCTGCGACEYYCPATPGGGIFVN